MERYRASEASSAEHHRLRGETALGTLSPLMALALAACGGGGGGSGRISLAVHNGTTVIDEHGPGEPARIITQRNGAPATIDPADNSELEFKMGLERMSGHAVVFDADYSIRVDAPSGVTAPAVPNANIPARLMSDQITPDTADKGAWLGVAFIEDGKALAEYFYNTRTGQQDLVVNEDNVSSLVPPERFDILVRFTVTVHTMEVDGQDVLDAFFNDPANIRSYQQQGVEVAGNTLTQVFTYRFVGVHDIPETRDATIDARGDIAVTGRFDDFLISHFFFDDSDDGDRLVRVEILSTPDHGRLTVERPSEEVVPVGVIGHVARDDIAHLVYTPHNVPMDDSFDFRVSDGDASGAGTITLDVV